MIKKATHKTYLTIALSLSLIIGIILSISTYYINYWPTDSYVPYIPVASKLFELSSFSQMHSVLVNEMFWITMHGKETLILAIAVMQKILGDTQSLFPNTLLLIISVQVSAVLVYFIIKKFFDEHIGFLTYILFVTCFWPYLYVLQGSHQNLSLVNFLLSIFFLQHTQKHRLIYILSGIFLGFMIFSSPTSPLFFPYYLAILIFLNFNFLKKGDYLKLFLNCLLILSGALGVFLLFTLPNPIESINDYIKFIQMSQNKNTFMIYRNFVSQYFFVNQHFRGAGWSWIFKYFFFIMPVIFPSYLACLAYLAKKSIKRPAILIIISLSLLTPIAVEISQVAQFGRNYFPWIIGILGLISCALYFLKNDFDTLPPLLKKLIPSLLILLTSIHIIFNFQIFATDIFPSRMATTNIYNWCIKNNITELNVYRQHPRNKNTVHFFNNPKSSKKIKFIPIQTIKDAKQGYIFIPPISGKTVFHECREGDYQGDRHLTELLLSGNLSKYVIKSFKTLGSSHVWTQEEELCTYRDLILNQISDEDREKGYALILDAKKLQEKYNHKKR